MEIQLEPRAQPPPPDTAALQLKTLKLIEERLRSTRAMLIFFTTLTVVGLLLGFMAAVELAQKLRAVGP